MINTTFASGFNTLIRPFASCKPF